MQLKHNLEAQEKHAMDVFNDEENHEVEVIPLVEVAPTPTQATMLSSNNSSNEHFQIIITSGSTKLQNCSPENIRIKFKT